MLLDYEKLENKLRKKWVDEEEFEKIANNIGLEDCTDTSFTGFNHYLVYKDYKERIYFFEKKKKNYRLRFLVLP